MNYLQECEIKFEDLLELKIFNLDLYIIHYIYIIYLYYYNSLCYY